jgi:RHS repeat-associated protein
MGEGSEELQFTGHERDIGNLDYMHARYYSQGSGRFLSKDTARISSSIRSQKWNQYIYTRNNPIRFIDPDGKNVQISADGPSVEDLKEFLVQTIMRPTGRLVLQSYAGDPVHTVVFRSRVLTSPAVIRHQMATGNTITVTCGNTGGKVTVGDVTTVGVNIDVNAVQNYHDDDSGVTTVGHELYHVNDQFSDLSNEELREGDSPTAESGPAEQYGHSIFAEEPDITEEEARILLDEWLEQSS